MNNDEEWVIVDTETDGLYEPIRVIEIAAQRMRGWEPIGDPFRVLLNHNVPISKQVVRIHGYSAEYLSQHGADPIQAHESFRQYAGQAPIVSHNLAFDWNRCLDLEWQRLGIPQIGKRGFCTLKVARRLLPEAPDHKLQTLKALLRLDRSQAHRALNDVATVVDLLRGECRRRLELLGVTSLNDIILLTNASPGEIKRKVTELLNLGQFVERASTIRHEHKKSYRKEHKGTEELEDIHRFENGKPHDSSAFEVTLKEDIQTIDAIEAIDSNAGNTLHHVPSCHSASHESDDQSRDENASGPRDSWFWLGHNNKLCGPLPSFYIRDYIKSGKTPYYVWSVGMKEWEWSDQCTKFEQSYKCSKLIPTPTISRGTQSSSAAEVAKACRRIVAFGSATEHEVRFLGDWLSDTGHSSMWPGIELSALIDKLLEDDILSETECNEFARYVQKLFR